jgi:hypothetical protein
MSIARERQLAAQAPQPLHRFSFRTAAGRPAF